MPSQAVLVFGDDSRAFLAVVRSLGRHGLEVHACPFDHSSSALSSRYIAAVHRLPPYNLDPEGWVGAVQQLLARRDYALVVPCDDRSILPLRRHAEAWGSTRLALPNERAFLAFFDKLETRRLAEQAGVAICAGEGLGPGSGHPDSAPGLVDTYGLPVVLKPRRSFELGQVTSRRSVGLVRSTAGLRIALAGLDRPEDYLLEAFFAGDGVGVSILAAQGRVLQAFQHHRVIESDPTGGSTYRVSARLDPALLKAVEALAAASELHGVAMFEFRRNMRTGQSVLLEVNARFWGSLPLAIASGIDFPAQLYDLLVQGREHPRIEYRVGQYARSIVNDAYRLARDLGDRDRPLPLRLGRLAGEVVAGLARVITGREKQDSLALDDLKPWAAEWREIGTWLSGGLARRLPARLRRFHAARSQRRLCELLSRRPGSVRKMLVLCSGNICRSPFAAALLKQQLASLRPDIEVASAGFIAREMRRSPDMAVAQAALFGVRLEDHRSRFARDRDLDEADAILIFDQLNEADLARRGIRAQHRTIMMGDFGPTPSPIEDPYGGSAGIFHETYERIAHCAKAIAACLRP